MNQSVTSGQAMCTEYTRSVHLYIMRFSDLRMKCCCFSEESVYYIVRNYYLLQIKTYMMTIIHLSVNLQHWLDVCVESEVVKSVKFPESYGLSVYN